AAPGHIAPRILLQVGKDLEQTHCVGMRRPRGSELVDHLRVGALSTDQFGVASKQHFKSPLAKGGPVQPYGDPRWIGIAPDPHHRHNDVAEEAVGRSVLHDHMWHRLAPSDLGRRRRFARPRPETKRPFPWADAFTRWTRTSRRSQVSALPRTAW